MNILLSKSVDGFIFYSAGVELSNIKQFTGSNIPVVVVDRDVPIELADIVMVDNEKGRFDATNHLIKLGHTNIGCIIGPNDLSSSME